MKILRGLGLVMLALIGAAWASRDIEIGEGLPDHAILLANGAAQTYATVPCIIRGDVDEPYVANVAAVAAGTEEVWYEATVEPITKKEARTRNLRPDRRCADSGGFTHSQPWMLALVGRQPKRVADDGTVLW